MNNKTAKKIRKYYRGAAERQGIRDINEWMDIQKRKVKLWRTMSIVMIAVDVVLLSWGLFV